MRSTVTREVDVFYDGRSRVDVNEHRVDLPVAHHVPTSDPHANRVSVYPRHLQLYRLVLKQRTVPCRDRSQRLFHLPRRFSGTEIVGRNR